MRITPPRDWAEVLEWGLEMAALLTIAGGIIAFFIVWSTK